MQPAAPTPRRRRRGGAGDSMMTARPPDLDHLLTVTARPHPHHQVLVLHLAGDVDLATVATLRHHLTEGLTAGWRGVVLDLTKVTFLAGCGLGALLDAVDQANTHGVSLRLITGQTRPVRRCLTAAGLIDTLPQAPTLTDAIHHCTH